MKANTLNTPQIALPADITGPAIDDLRLQLRKILALCPTTVGIACEGLDRVISAHISLLWESYQVCAEADVAIRLLSPGPGLIRILEALDLREFFGVDDDDVTLVTSGSSRVSRVQPHRYSDRFTASRTDIDEAIARFLQFLDSVNLPELVRFEIRTVFYEVATNIRMHGGKASTTTIAFRVNLDSTQISLTFVDTGVPFNPVAGEMEFDGAHAVRAGQKHGFGLAMIHKLMNKVSYKRRYNSVNILTLEKQWSQNYG